MSGAIDYGVEPARRRARALRRAAIIALTVFLCGFGCWWGVIRSFEPRLGVNVSREQAEVSDLPPDARNVSYRLGGAMDPNPATYEFDASEESFRAWAKAQGSVLEEGETQIVRFDDSRVTLQRALFFNRRTSPDSGWHVAYDLDAGRAYFSSNTR